ncbi:hypothetical protein N7454_001161 [Penicillium verhagenii]|nr:hypothetical protein N7454_001161 [Penicillium verhagenii]
MQHYSRSDFLDAGSLTRSRSTSLSSDSRVNLMSPPTVRPPPGFISSAAASEIITSDQEFNAADFVAEDEDTGATATALVTPAALSLLNAFLDNLLFNVLAASKSTQLACIRPILADVLKPRLAQEVVATADEELGEYMGGEDDEESDFRGGQEPGGDFDLVRSWKLTRLRCMVYTRLGDMEEEDEDEFIAQEGLGESDGAPRRFSSHVDNITPAAAIFLTSIIEHIGERALVIAGETARSRLSTKLNDTESQFSDDMEDHRKRIERLVVEDLDMEKLALNATLGRLWRTWRKRRRGTTLSRTLSRESFRRRTFSHTLVNSRKSSIVTIEEPITPTDPAPEELPVPIDPIEVPLPMGDHDIEEIEVPGYNPDMEGEVAQTMQAVVAHKVRPRSLMVVPSPSLVSRSGNSPLSASAVESPLLRHLRSRSLPNHKDDVPPAAAQADQDEEADELSPDQPSPKSGRTSRSSSKEKQLETMYEDDESAEFVDAAESATGIAVTTESDEFKESLEELSEREHMSVVQEEEEEAAPAVGVTIASLRSRMHEDEDEGTDQADSNRVSVSSIDGPTQDPEVIEGQGMCEKPKLTSTIHRPKRKSSRDVSQSYAKPIIAETTRTGTPADATIEAIKAPSDIHAVEGDHNKSDIGSVSELGTLNEAVISEKSSEIPSEPVIVTEPFPFPGSDPSAVEFAAAEDLPISQSVTPEPAASPDVSRAPSTSGDSELSQQSRTRRRPTPLIVTTSNRSSPTLEQRAAVQRMSGRPTTSIASSVLTKPRRSESFNSTRDKRPVTAGSTTSQVSTKLKGLMNRPPGESPSLRLRSSSETSRASGSGDSLDNDTTDLDKLINSDETIHFTLTPRSVREMTFPDIPRPVPRSDTTNTTDLAEFLKNTGPPGADPRASISSRATGDQAIGIAKSADSPKYIPLSSRMSLSPTTAAAAGPPREVRTSSPTANNSSGPTSAPSPTIDSPRSVRTQPSISSNRSNPNRPKLQARAAETRGSETSELIDFIRQGPPQSGARIPRTVAPFRNTVDSDDIHVGSQNGSLASGSSVNKSYTSFGSRTGLLDSNQRPSGQAKASPSTLMAEPAEPPRPARKQRRVPDPYAIDDDDDDDLLEELLQAKPPPRQEESLIDFLRSEPPPDFKQAQPQPLSVRPPASSSSNGSGSMKSRLTAGRAPSSKMSVSSMRSQNNPPSNYSLKVGMERNPGIMPSATNRQTETSALADFLRNTGPPEAAPQSSMSPKTKEGGISRFFTRRKKFEA